MSSTTRSKVLWDGSTAEWEPEMHPWRHDEEPCADCEGFGVEAHGCMIQYCKECREDPNFQHEYDAAEPGVHQWGMSFYDPCTRCGQESPTAAIMRSMADNMMQSSPLLEYLKRER